jgi:hypothetical protein
MIGKFMVRVEGGFPHDCYSRTFARRHEKDVLYQDTPSGIIPRYFIDCSCIPQPTVSQTQTLAESEDENGQNASGAEVRFYLITCIEAESYSLPDIFFL